MEIDNRFIEMIREKFDNLDSIDVPGLNISQKSIGLRFCFRFRNRNVSKKRLSNFRDGGDFK